MTVLDEKVGPEDGLVSHRPHGQGERPLAQPLLAARDADGRDTEAFLDGLTGGDAVVGDGGPENDEAAFVDQLTVGVDHRLDGPLGQAFDLAEHDLHRTVEQAPLETLLEDQLEGQHQVVARFLGISLRELEVEQVADLDRFGGTDVGHRPPLSCATAQ